MSPMTQRRVTRFCAIVKNAAPTQVITRPVAGNIKEDAPVDRGKRHPRRGARTGRDKVVDDAAIICQSRVDRAQVLEEFLMPAALDAEGTAKAELRVKDFACNPFVSAVPTALRRNARPASSD
jgi:hypothetical protein